MVLSCRFPFLTAPFDLHEAAFPKGFSLPPGYLADEPVAGLLLATPWVWFLPVSGFLAARAIRATIRSRAYAELLDPRTRPNVWFVVGFAVIATVTALPIIAVPSTTMRYLVEFSAGLLMLALWGAWSLYMSVRDRPWPRRAVTVAIVGITVATIVIGLLLGVTGYNGMFERNNPALFQRLARAFSMCGR
jgi:hypothetical protein